MTIKLHPVHYLWTACDVPSIRVYVIKIIEQEQLETQHENNQQVADEDIALSGY